MQLHAGRIEGLLAGTNFVVAALNLHGFAAEKHPSSLSKDGCTMDLEANTFEPSLGA